ncbi:MAG: TIGR04086 family membrane protein [Methanobacterium sp.]|nr:TIGR04086 family membrane protein [Methanobacterium sp.]
MRLNPVRSIFLGLLVFFVVFLIAESLHRFILLFLSFFLGGFIVMYFTREKKLQYLFYEGILVLIFSTIMYTIMYRLSVNGFIYSTLFVLIFTLLGGIIGKFADQAVEKKSLNFHPVISIALGVIISFIIFDFVFSLIPIGVSDSIFQQISTIESMGSLVIGGCIATYFAKEKKIKNGIYVGMTWILIYFIPSIIFFGLSSLSNPINTVLMYIGFIIASTIGSYLAILIDKRQKLNI